MPTPQTDFQDSPPLVSSVQLTITAQGNSKTKKALFPGKIIIIIKKSNKINLSPVNEDSPQPFPNKQTAPFCLELGTS